MHAEDPGGLADLAAGVAQDAGDVPRFSYNTTKLRALGWSPAQESDAAIRLTAERILANGF